MAPFFCTPRHAATLVPRLLYRLGRTIVTDGFSDNYFETLPDLQRGSAASKSDKLSPEHNTFICNNCGTIVYVQPPNLTESESRTRGTTRLRYAPTVIRRA